METEAPAEGALSGQNACRRGAWRRLKLPVVHKIYFSRNVEGEDAISVRQGDQSNYALKNVWRRIRLNIYFFSYISLVYISMSISDYVLAQEHENPYRQCDTRRKCFYSSVFRHLDTVGNNVCPFSGMTMLKT